MKLVIVYVYVFMRLPYLSNQNAIYLFNTEDNDGIEYYDCVILDAVPYCRRPSSPAKLDRDKENYFCYNRGNSWTFEQLRSQNRTWNQVVHGFQSSIEKAEEYALYISGLVNSSSVCECPERSFGKRCEYRIIGASEQVTLPESFKWQNDQKKENRLQMQAYQKNPCYITLICDYGLLCLDWRDICDGKQQCMDGIDEESCDLLEFNECEYDEYRCSNGMCIPESYFLDGEYDCMDHSDEQQPFDDNLCAYQSNPFNCDEHVCTVTEWSCGDGQCISERNRYQWQEYATTSDAQCHSMREYLFICELSDRYELWTSINGTCYDSSLIDLLDEEWNRYNQSSNDYCLYLIKCALSDGVELNCPCKRSNCDYYITKVCPYTIAYPSKGLLAPYLIAYYTNERTWSGTKKPNFYQVSGSIRCRGYYAKTFINRSILLSIFFDIQYFQLEKFFCDYPYTWKHTDGPQFHTSCYANVSRTLGKQSSYAFFNVCNRCISQYRINDGVKDCSEGEDEQPQRHNTCANPIRRHRFHCSDDYETCLLAKTLGDSVTHCNNGNDEYTYGSGESLSKTICKQFDDDGCRFLREYISRSANYSDGSTGTTLNNKMPFRSYCNTFWDLKDQSDESATTCRSWVCAQNEYQCDTGQCISQKYVCDGEWDCPDASDELFDMNYLSEHNQMFGLTEQKVACARRMNNTVQAFGSLCSIATEYPCLLLNFTHPSNILHTRPCLNISQIGDGKIDCLGGLDERNTQTHCRGISQLGFTFQCRSTPKACIDEQKLCIDRCPNLNDDLLLCGDDISNHSDTTYFICMNGTRINNARCNQKFECEYGEDEYWCGRHGLESNSKQYRIYKQQAQLTAKKFVKWPLYPSKKLPAVNVINNNEQRTVVKRNILVDVPSSIAALLCNRGVAVSYYTNTTVCFCPPAYYGDYCEFHNDRVISYVHLNYSASPYAYSSVDDDILVKVLVLFIHENQVIDSHQFHSRPSYDLSHRVKKKHYFIYSKDAKLLEEKMDRIQNRSSVVNHSPYYLQYEAYELHVEQTITFLGVWKYPIYFDFLPSFRFSKILRHVTRSACQSNPCNSSNAQCHILQNDPKKYVCLCKSGYTGENCSIEDRYCANKFCHQDAVCKPSYLGIVASNRLPFCLCPLDKYGTKCALTHDQCSKNPCKNNATCYASTSDLTKVNCACKEDYYGTSCEFRKKTIEFLVDTTNVTGISVVQYFYVDWTTLDLNLAHQAVYEQPPDYLPYRCENQYTPNIVLLKTYPSIEMKYPTIFVLLLSNNDENITLSITLANTKLCLNVDQIQKNLPVSEYHRICRDNSSADPPLCFFDDQYLCICEENNYRAECFLYDHQLDRCDQCYSDGRCIRGDRQKQDDFRCLCSKCHYGSQCQYSSEDFSFTYEQIFAYGLLSTATTTRQLTIYAMISIACFLVIAGAFNNLCTFVTFYRSKFLRIGVGNYLLVGSVVNQINLFFVAFRLIQVALSTAGYLTTEHLTISKVLCRSVPYALTSSGQLSYWLMSTVAIERLYVTWNIKGRWLKRPRIARRIMFILTMIILIINVPQIISYNALNNERTDVKSVTCVLIYPHHLWTLLNQAANYINNLLPLLINVSCTSGIIFLIVRQKLLASKKSTASSEANVVNDQKSNERIQSKSRWNFFRTVLHENLDLIFGPAITIVPQLFSLPYVIFSSTIGCQDFGDRTVRYSLMVALSVLCIPQLTSFFLYVRFSSAYYSHFRSTAIGKRILLLCPCCRPRNLEQSMTYSQPSPYIVSNINKLDTDLVTEYSAR